MACLVFVSVNVSAQIFGCDSSCNLIKNGNFSMGNTGFTSDLPFNCTCGAGTYCVGPMFKSKCSSWPTTTDHTGAGKYLLIDGHPTAPKDVWKKTVPVCKGVKYTFSFWSKNVYGTMPSAAVEVGVYINGTLQVPLAIVNTVIWKQYTITWTAGTTGLVPLKLRQMTGGGYRDFGIDDIFFGFCKKDHCACNPN